MKYKLNCELSGTFITFLTNIRRNYSEQVGIAYLNDVRYEMNIECRLNHRDWMLSNINSIWKNSDSVDLSVSKFEKIKTFFHIFLFESFYET